MSLTAGTLYECLESHVVLINGAQILNKKGDLRLGASAEAAANEVMWVAVGSSDAQIRTARTSAGLPTLG